MRTSTQSKTFTTIVVMSVLETVDRSTGRPLSAFRWKEQRVCTRADVQDLKIIKEIYENKLAGLLWERIIGEENRLFNGHTL